MVNKNYKVNVTPPPLPMIEDSGGDLNFFDPTNPDINLFNLVDDEIIRLSGSKLYFYKF